MEIEVERIVKLEEREKANTHRIDKLERLFDIISEQNTNIAELVVELKHTNEALKCQGQRLDVIESQPRSRLNIIFTAIVSAVISAGIGVLIGQLF